MHQFDENQPNPQSDESLPFHPPVRRHKKNTPQSVNLWRTIIILSVTLVFCLFMAIACSSSGTEPSTPSQQPTSQLQLQLQLLGDETVTLEYGTEFSDPGVQVLCQSVIIDADVAVDMPQIQALGSYTVTYTVHYEGHTASITRTLEVVDTTAPVITLLKIPGYCTELGETYVEEGFTAIDALDGDLTNQVIRTVEGDVIRYTVTDASGNTATAERIITYGDTTAPVITLEGGNDVSVFAGTDYTDPGFSATDNVDGDLTDSVSVSGTYNKYVPGIYPFTYTVTDAHGNTATVQRNVIVECVACPETVIPEEKVIYLTFDDGPGNHTLQLLETLEKYNVKATFFVVGDASMAYLDEIAAGGHSIGIHSYTHEMYEIYASEEAFFEDFFKLRDEIYELTGIYTNLCRFPGGSSNTISRYNPGIMTRLTAAVRAMGYQYFDWNVDSDDAGRATTPDEVFNNVIQGVQFHGGSYSVVLMHDIKGFSVKAVEQIILWGLENGYTFLPLDQTSPPCHHPVNN